MPEIPLYAQGLPPKAGGVPDMPLDREPRGRVNLSGVSSAARERGRIAAEAALANQTPLLPENMYAGLERGQQRLAAGVEHLGGVMGVIAVRQQEAQNYIDVTRSNQQMQEAYAAHVEERQQLDPREWRANLQKHLEALPNQWQSEEGVSPAAQQERMDRFRHFATMRDIETGTQVVQAKVHEANAMTETVIRRAKTLTPEVGMPVIEEETRRAVDEKRMSEAEANRLKLEATYHYQDQELKAFDDRIEIAKLDPKPNVNALKDQAQAFVAAGRMTKDQADLAMLKIQDIGDMAETRSMAATNPYEAEKKFRALNEQKDNWAYKPEWSAQKRSEHLHEIAREKAFWDHNGVNYAKDAIAVNKWKTAEEAKAELDGTMSPHLVTAMASMVNTTVLDEVRFAQQIEKINKANVIAPDNALTRGNLQTENGTFPPEYEKVLNAMTAERWDENNRVIDQYRKAGELQITEMFKSGQMGDPTVPVKDPKTGLALAKPVTKWLIPKTKGFLWWERPGTAADAEKIADVMEPVTEESQQSAAFKSYMEALTKYRDEVTREKITDMQKISEKVNAVTRPYRIRGANKVTESVDPDTLDGTNHRNRQLFPDMTPEEIAATLRAAEEIVNPKK